MIKTTTQAVALCFCMIYGGLSSATQSGNCNDDPNGMPYPSVSIMGAAKGNPAPPVKGVVNITIDTKGKSIGGILATQDFYDTRSTVGFCKAPPGRSFTYQVVVGNGVAAMPGNLGDSFNEVLGENIAQTNVPGVGVAVKALGGPTSTAMMYVPGHLRPLIGGPYPYQYEQTSADHSSVVNSKQGFYINYSKDVAADNPELFPWIAFGIDSASSTNYRVYLFKTGEIQSGALTGSAITMSVDGVVFSRIDFGGNAVGSDVGCTANTSNISVNFDKVSALNLNQVGSRSDAKDFQIDLNCKMGTKIQLAMSANPAQRTTFPGVLGVSGGAQGIGIEILKDGVPLPLDTPQGYTVNTPDNSTYSIPMKARYVRLAEQFSPGRADSSATFTMTFL